MKGMSQAARTQIKGSGLTIRAYLREWQGDDISRWYGDICGCRDDRCIGYHHEEHDECGCLPALIAMALEPRAAVALEHEA